MVTTPRRSTRARSITPGSSARKRRRVLVRPYKKKRIYRVPRGMRIALKRSLEEKKRVDRLFNVNTKRSFTSVLIGSDIGYGTLTSQRIGGRINLTGVSIKGSFQHTEQSAVDSRFTGPVVLKCYLIMTHRTDNPISYWYQNTNNDNNIAYNAADFTNDPLGDRKRLDYKLNLADMKIMMARSYKVYPRSSGTANTKCMTPVTMYKKMFVPIHYNTLLSDTIPYGQDKVRPNVFFCAFIESPDEGGTDAQMIGQFKCFVTTYFTE